MAIINRETNTEIEAKDRLKAEHEQELADTSKLSLGFKDDLAAHIRHAWEKAIWDKQDIQDKMIANLNQIRGVYDPEKLAAIKELGSEVYPLITDVKCRAAIAVIRKVFKEKPWTIEPTPVPTLTSDTERAAEMTMMGEVQKWYTEMLSSGNGQNIDPAQLQQQITEMVPKFKKKFVSIQKEVAKEKAQRMEDKIQDQLVEGGFYRALNDAVEDFVKLDACFLKGPIYRKKKIRTLRAGTTGKAVIGLKEEIIPEWEAPSPFDIFPLPGVSDINRGGLIERLRYIRTDIQNMIGMEGFDETAIREILGHYHEAALHEWTWSTKDIERKKAEGVKIDQYYDWDEIECLEYHGPVPGQKLIDWAQSRIPEGKTIADVFDRDIDKDFDYNVQAILVDRWILKVTINENPLGLKPYYKASYIGEKGSFWGRGLPEAIVDAQQMCCQSARAIQNNVGMASGPQIALDISTLPPGSTPPSKITPWKIWPFIRKLFTSSEQKLLEFYQPQMHAQELLQVYQAFEKDADSRSGVMGATHGDRSISGAGSTASGFSMFLGTQSVGIEDVMGEFDEYIIQPAIQALYYENYDLDDALEYIGDVKIVARGSQIVLAKQQEAIRLTEFMRATANPIDAQLQGMQGRRYLQQETARRMHLDVDKLIPEEDMLKPLPGADQGQAPAPGERRLDAAGNPVQGVENRIAPTGPNAGA